jgi:hypothetical protein
MIDTRQWRLVAPWYHWDRQLAQQGFSPRQTRPVFQKFDQSDFVKGFTRDPQRSLKFDETIDRVSETRVTDAPPAPPGPFAGKFTRLFVPKPKNEGDPVVAKDAELVVTKTRKLYLDTHKRSYLVVCELHCDAPGFPTATPDQVCESGFAIRRRSLNFPSGAKKEATQLLQNVVAIQSEIAYFNQTSPARGLSAKRRLMTVQKLKKEGKFEETINGLKVKLTDARLEIVKWKDACGVVQVHEGWVPSEFENIGSWQYVDETPAQLAEATYPLYRLFPDPNIPDHSAKGRNIYFGVVPTSSLDTDESGNARFDSDALYEIRCYVRRHKPDCPRRDEKPDCPGEIVWSAPTESYRLATPSDLIGTSQRPVTIQMPDLAELAAQVKGLPLKKFSPVKVVQPQGLKFSVDDGKATGGEVGPQQICFISIPLITIVAMFVFNLFLPIVVFLFNLYFLLALKFCIPPSFDLKGGLQAELDAVAPAIQADATFSVDANFSLTPAGGGAAFNQDELKLDLKDSLSANAGVTASIDTDKLNDFSNAALLPVGGVISEVDKLAASVRAGASVAAGVDLTGSLQYEPRVEVKVL